MRKLIRSVARSKALLAGAAVAATTTLAAAQATGTNAVTAISDNVNNASGVLYPIMIGLIGVFMVVGLAKKFLRKGGASA